MLIPQEEIEQMSAALDVHTSNVQRDYVFGWLLAGLFEVGNPLGRHVALKGGNAFRKGYFESARYSTDLDFSAAEDLSDAAVTDGIEHAVRFAQQKSGVAFDVRAPRVSSRSLIGEEGRMFDARVYFKSFYAEEEVALRVDLDIKEFDRVFLPIQSRQLIHSYSDRAQCQATIRCHKLEELLAAKLKALLQRQHSPDLYDFVHSVFFQKSLQVNRLELVRTFLKKSIYAPVPTVARGLLLDLPFQVIRGLWEEYLVCPSVAAISFDQAVEWFRAGIPELFALLAPSPTLAYSRSAARSPTVPTHFGSSHRGTIMEAGRLQRILRIVYDGATRLVEPYALTVKRRQDGEAAEYFYAWDLSGGRSGRTGIKSFFASKLQSVQMTPDTFSPRFPVELAKGGIGYFSSSTFSTARAPALSQSRQRLKTLGSQLKVTCPYCGKSFSRSTYDSKLNPHKDRFGNNCPGRFGSVS